MDNLNQLDKSFLEKLQLYFQNYPGRCCDISFVVGRGEEKEVVETSRIILEVACPEFIRLFDEKWGQAVAVSASRNEELGIEGIPLPNVSPKVFKIFLKLLMLDNVSVNSLKKVNIPPKDLLDVIELCREYRLNTIQQNLDIIAQEVLVGFSEFSNTKGFLGLSKSNLSTVLCSENLEASECEIFDATMRWAENQCYERGIENTGEKLREILGECVFAIRFPTMTAKDFTKCVHRHNVLTLEEQLKILKFIALNDDPNEDQDIVLPFNKTKRSGQFYAKLQFFKPDEIRTMPGFVCDGAVYTPSYIKVNQEIDLHCVGFLGPVDSDSFYDVTVEIFHDSGSDTISCGKLEKRVFAQKDKLFYVYFDQPVRIEASSTFTEDCVMDYDYYFLNCSLKGPKTLVAETEHDTNLRTETKNGEGFFYCMYEYPLAELCFKKCQL